MKALLLTISIALLISGCGSIKKQQHIGKIMETHVFDVPADELYKATEAEFKKMYTPLKSTGKNTGASAWVSQQSKLGEKEYTEKSRFAVEIIPVNSKSSRLTIHRESQSNYLGDWGNISRGRMYIYEFNVQRRLDPLVAQKIDQKAETMK